MSEQNKQQSKPDSEQEEMQTNQADDKHINGDGNEEANANQAEASAETDEQSSGDVIDELAAAQLEITKYKDAYLRAKAEEENVRRRSEKEVANSRKFAVEGFSKEMLNVRDSLNLACSVDLPEGADESLKNIHDGVAITLKQLDSAFAKFSVIEVSPEVGDKLDPNVHQAMSMIESDEIESGCIISVIQAGFTLHERLLRPAMVVVAK